jgi:hypothetical protein
MILPPTPRSMGPCNHLVGALAGCSLREPVSDAESPPPRLQHLSCLWSDSIQVLPKLEPAELMGVGQDRSPEAYDLRQHGPCTEVQ